MSAPPKDAFIQYHLKTEALHDGHGPAVMLTQQDDIEDPVTIMLHPWQLRAACQHLGIVHADPEAERAAGRLTRRLRSLAERIAHLNDWLHQHSDTRHADLTYEQTYSQATADLAAEFLADSEESRPIEPEQGVLL